MNSNTETKGNSRNDKNDIKASCQTSIVNNKLVNLNKLNADVHDQAYFTNFSKLNHLKEFSSYSTYRLNISKLNFSNTFSYSTPDNIVLRENEPVVLDKLVESIYSDLVRLSQNEKSLFSFCSSHQDQHNHLNHSQTSCKSECLVSILDEQAKWLDLSFVQFFLNTLNGNFFKLKHLNDFIHDYYMGQCQDSNSAKSDVLLCLEALSHVNKFLKLPCVLNLFQLALRTKILQ